MPIPTEDQNNGMKAYGKSYGSMGGHADNTPKSFSVKSGMKSGKQASGMKPIKSVANPFKQDSAGKLNKSGASTRSESLARLRGKGALA